MKKPEKLYQVVIETRMAAQSWRGATQLCAKLRELSRSADLKYETSKTVLFPGSYAAVVRVEPAKPAKKEVKQYAR